MARVDFLFFASFLKTKDENSGLIRPFLLPEEGYEYLTGPLDALLDPGVRQIFLRKGRQMFFTWLWCAWELWKMNCCREGEIWFGGLMAHREDDVKPIIERTWFMYSHLPDWLRAPLSMHNKMQLHLASGKKGLDGQLIAKAGLDGYPANAEVGRSRTLSSFRVEEAAYVPNFGKVVASVKPTMSGGNTKFSALSTADNPVSDFIRAVERPNNDPHTKIFRIFRDQHPVYKTAEFKRLKIAEYAQALGSPEKAIRKFGNEYDGSLEGDTGLVYPSYDDGLHVCAPFDVPVTWPLGVYIDPHTVKPTAITLTALSPDCLYIVGQIWETDTAKGLVDRMRADWALFANQITTWRIDPHCDSENALVDSQKNIFDEFRRHLPGLQHAPGTPQNRIDAVRERLKVRPMTGRPGLMIFSTCERVRWEFLHYCTKLDLNDQPKIHKVDDDFMDDVGYAAVSPPLPLKKVLQTNPPYEFLTAKADLHRPHRPSGSKFIFSTGRR